MSNDHIIYENKLYEELYAKLFLEMILEFPEFSIKLKSSSKLMKIIDKTLKIISFGKMDRFDRFITTIGYVVYVPDFWNERDFLGKYVVLSHERVHMYQLRNWQDKLGKFLGRIGFSLSYAFWPLPIGITHRLKYEAAAYAISIILENQLVSSPIKDNIEYRAKQLASASYIWATFSEKKAAKLLTELVASFLNEISDGQN